MEVGIRQLARRSASAVVCMLVLAGALPVLAQRGRGRGNDGTNSQAEMELQKGVELTRAGRFQEAIPHFVAARGQVSNDFAAAFNLALCYVATAQYEPARKILNELRSGGNETAPVENLLAQALIGSGKPDEALAAVERSARLAPKDEKLYLLFAEACFDGGYFDDGLKAVELGLRHLPNAPRLLFERGVLLAQVDRLDDARKDFARTVELAPGQDIAYIAGAQRSLFDGDVAEAARLSREGIEKGNAHFMLLAIFGEATLLSGATPGQPQFADAQTALERVVADRPNYASSQVSLGKLYLLANRLDDAIAHLETARRLDPTNTAVYSNLAKAYRRKGDTTQAEAALATLAKLNQQQADRIGSAPGDRKAGYASRTSTPAKPPQ